MNCSYEFTCCCYYILPFRENIVFFKAYRWLIIFIINNKLWLTDDISLRNNYLDSCSVSVFGEAAHFFLYL